MRRRREKNPQTNCQDSKCNSILKGLKGLFKLILQKEKKKKKISCLNFSIGSLVNWFKIITLDVRDMYILRTLWTFCEPIFEIQNQPWKPLKIISISINLISISKMPLCRKLDFKFQVLIICITTPFNQK